MLSLILGLVGLAVGSFLNVVIDRLPRGESLLFPSSRCEACGHGLSTRDLLPILSYVMLRGKCRYCDVPISWRLPLVELLTGGLFAFLAWRLGPGLELASSLVYVLLFVPIFFIDLERGIIPDVIVFPGMALALGLALLEGRAVAAVVGGAVGFGLFLSIYYLARRGMGQGDVKLAGLLGLINGWPLILVAVLLSLISGGLVASVFLAMKAKGRKDPVPFGPFLVVGSFVTLLWGQRLLDLYLKLFA
jgi:leader peptidase (prepilin peptidase)/N-methyltransferase